MFADGGWILKKGDTHWQNFFSVSLQDPEQFYHYENPDELALTFRNHTLYYVIPKDTDKENHYIVPQYELQKDGTRRLNACFHREKICPVNEDCKLKQKKLLLKQCENL